MAASRRLRARTRRRVKCQYSAASAGHGRHGSKRTKSSQKVTGFNQFVAVRKAAEFGLGSGNAAHCEAIASCWRGPACVAFGLAGVLRAPGVKLTVSKVFF